MRTSDEQILQLAMLGISYADKLKTIREIRDRDLQDSEQTGYTRGYDIGFDAGTRSKRQDTVRADKAATGDSERNITRVEVVDQEGRSYVNWDANNSVFTSIQDEGRTLKVFIKDRT